MGERTYLVHAVRTSDGLPHSAERQDVRPAVRRLLAQLGERVCPDFG